MTYKDKNEFTETINISSNIKDNKKQVKKAKAKRKGIGKGPEPAGIPAPLNSEPFRNCRCIHC